MRRFVLVPIALLSASAAGPEPSSAPSVRWVGAGHDARADYYYDEGHVERAHGIVRFRVKARLHAGIALPFRTAFIRNELDCAEQTHAILSVELFDAHGAPVPRPTEAPADDGAHMPISAGVDETIYRRLCPAPMLRPLRRTWVWKFRSDDSGEPAPAPQPPDEQS